MDPYNLDAIAFLACALSTAPDPTFPNGAEALRLSGACVEITERQEPFYLTALAAAYAETGQFSRAIQTSEEALALPLAKAQPELEASIAQDIKLYRSGKANHSSYLVETRPQ